MILWGEGRGGISVNLRLFVILSAAKNLSFRRKIRDSSLRFAPFRMTNIVHVSTCRKWGEGSEKLLRGKRRKSEMAKRV
jgi:hypothetical protein